MNSCFTPSRDDRCLLVDILGNRIKNWSGGYCQSSFRFRIERCTNYSWLQQSVSIIRSNSSKRGYTE